MVISGSARRAEGRRPEARRVEPVQKKTPNTTLVELKETIESFAQSMDEEEVKQAVRGIRRRARACPERNSTAFEERQ